MGQLEAGKLRWLANISSRTDAECRALIVGSMAGSGADTRMFDNCPVLEEN